MACRSCDMGLVMGYAMDAVGAARRVSPRLAAGEWDGQESGLAGGLGVGNAPGMKSGTKWMAVLALCALIGEADRALAEHRATFLGNPSTRFADPLVASEDLRWRFRDPKLKPDFAEVLRQWGWQGRLEDLFSAAEQAEIVAVEIPVGGRMPFMSTRRGGKPVCLKDVVWVGEKPAPAFAFTFASLGRRYRCVTPQACSNFFVEDLGVEPKPALAIDCSTPKELLPGRPIKVCLTVRNTGDGPESKVQVRLPLPEGASLKEATGGGAEESGQVVWNLDSVGPGASQEVCAVLIAARLGTFGFSASAAGAKSAEAKTSCETFIRGVPAILLEIVDLEDPIEVGGQVTYVIKVMNQGSAPGTKVRVKCTLADSQEYLSGSGSTSIRVDGRVLTTEVIPSLAPKDSAEWRLSVRAAKEDDARFSVELSSDQFEAPIRENESTRQY